MDEFFGISEFTKVAGVSRQRLYQLWERGKGPPRQARRAGRQQRVMIPVRPALAWLKGRYPERYATYKRLAAIADGPELLPSWQPFPVVIRGAFDRG